MTAGVPRGRIQKHARLCCLLCAREVTYNGWIRRHSKRKSHRVDLERYYQYNPQLREMWRSVSSYYNRVALDQLMKKFRFATLGTMELSPYEVRKEWMNNVTTDAEDRSKD